MAIEAHGVSKRFGEHAALSDVSVVVPDGSLTALLGPSGGGKSTLLRVIAGLEPPDEGRAVIDGADVTGIPAQKRDVGFVFQHYAAFKHMTVHENVAFALRIRKRPKDEVKRRVDELLAWCSSALWASTTRRSCPAASGSEWPSPAPWRQSLACSCSTSRSARSTPRCARSCAPGSCACTRRSRSRPSSSRTTRRRRWSCPTRSC